MRPISGDVRKVLTAIGVPVATFGPDGTPTFVSDAWRALPHDLVDDVAAVARRVHGTGVDEYVAELAILRDERLAYYALSCHPIDLDEGAGVLAVIGDITNDAIARRIGVAAPVPASGRGSAHAAWSSLSTDYAYSMARRMDEFLAVVSHELRAPLATLSLWVNVLRKQVSRDPATTMALDAIQSSAVAQARLVDDLLDLTRGIRGKLHIESRPLDIVRLTRDVVDAMRPAAIAKQTELVHHDSMGIGVVEGDVARLRQVLDNVIGNAIKFSPGGRVVVTSERRAGTIAIEVADNGCGLEPQFQTRIFQPFSQSDELLARTEGGLGLGLAISKQILELHGGTIVAASDGRGKGATLTITLPASPHRVLPRDETASTERLEKVNVLIIDDDRGMLDALRVLLQGVGAIVQTAESASEGFERLASTAADAIVCDLAMPGVDGFSLIRALRSAGNAAPAIAFTACATEQDARRALEAGFDRHLAKPIDFEQLIATIGELIAARRSSPSGRGPAITW